MSDYFIFDDFLTTYSQLKNSAENGEFKDHANNVDSVVYPLVCPDIPNEVTAEIEKKLNELFGRPIKINTIFMRRSPKGVHVPHQAHTDNSMGRWSMMIYMDDLEGAGTALISHFRTGIAYAPGDNLFINMLGSDIHDSSQWRVDDLIQMKENRAAIFKSHRFHRAEPVGGYGEGIESRVVLTVFFDD